MPVDCDTLPSTPAFEWHRHFREGGERVTDGKRSGRAQTSRAAENTEKVSAVVWNQNCESQNKTNLSPVLPVSYFAVCLAKMHATTTIQVQ
ncbi:hypothetical protein TNCV_441391 [Trichonephila clavipes]|nr:hypothetical protein TNCV_441391 [Trichonephila clavipes]